MKNTSLFTPYTAYSINGTAEGKLIYINKGNDSDFAELEKRNISVNGSILLSRAPLGFAAVVSTYQFQYRHSNLFSIACRQTSSIGPNFLLKRFSIVYTAGFLSAVYYYYIKIFVNRCISRVQRSLCTAAPPLKKKIGKERL